MAETEVFIGHIRGTHREKSDAFLEEHLVAKEPIGQFKAWFDEACARSDILEPNAMCVATATKDGIPSARFVLLKAYGKHGFKFFTNCESRKGKELAENPHVAVTFYWEPLHRSIRIDGIAERVPKEEAEKYFHTRPLDSQIAACVSHQSSVVESRDYLDEREEKLTKELVDAGKEVPMPDYWGGYLIRPLAVEFWQGQRNRLSDRIRFRKPGPSEIIDGKMVRQGEDGWVYERLAP